MTGQPIKLLLDEHIWDGLAEILGQRSYDADITSHASCPIRPIFRLDSSCHQRQRHFRLGQPEGQVHDAV
jgi:hypothetical protein